MWPEPIPLMVKLFGNLEELQSTVTFARGDSLLRLAYDV